MVQINFAQKQVNAKIVYYGPGMSGKTTNLEIVHQRAPTPNRGDLTSISTDGDRTLFFDFMPLDLGTVAGMRTCFQIYTVPGQVYYNSTRKLVLQGVDGVVFVADSSAAMIEENLESMRNLEQNLAEYGKNLATIPLIIQYNKRDLPDAMSVEELNKHLNPYNAPFFEAIANTGQGVFPTLKALAARVLETIHTGAKAPQTSTGQTGYHAGVNAQPAPAQQPLHQTGFHAPPPPQPAQPRLQQTGYHQMPQAGHAAPGQRSIPIPAPAAPPQPAQHYGQQQQQQRPSHAPPQLSMPPMPSQPAKVGGPMHPPMQPQQQHMPQVQQHPQQHMPPQQHAQPQHMQPPPQQGYGYAAPQAQPNAIGMATMQQQQQNAQQASALHMLRPGNAKSPAPSGQHKPRSHPAQRVASTQAEPAQRIQPRAAPMATPGAGGNRRMMYVGMFVVVALGIGAVVAKIVLKLF